MQIRINTLAELTELVRTEVAAERLDVRVDEHWLRDKWDIHASIDIKEIAQVLTDTFRSETNPNVVMTLYNGPILANVEIPEGLTIEDELWAFQADLSLLYGSKVWLMPAEPNAFGFGILAAYRMPGGPYRWGDEGLVRRYGVEVGRYSQSAERLAA
ncbi:hypothetical protein ASG43_17510 [Aureimonas sp. Leaf454]|uniref:hypothetical protein n=1 Tax=Aureimonas sp. Leaf454 TaxID=1736381 RepID=UPI0006F3FB04|nr:hypothetical protein [Aureimonas sp. Leaf454]KQT42073.1 hypothetical protein ASG43_17510 [Aureimonas sp. Leaf454]